MDVGFNAVLKVDLRLWELDEARTIEAEQTAQCPCSPGCTTPRGTTIMDKPLVILNSLDLSQDYTGAWT